jgi:hypothetical protein
MRKSISRTRSRWIRAGIATGASAAIVIAAATPAFAAVVPVTLSATTGPSASSTTTITASSTTAFLTGYTAPGAIFSVPACPTTYNTATVTPTAAVGNVPAPAAAVKKLSNLKAAITVPAGVVSVGSLASTKYNACIYGSSTAGSALLGNAVYNVALAPAITSISPTSGPALGGGTITVTGTGFPTTAGSITATIGGSPLLSVTPVSSTSFTAVTPAHAAANNLTLSISTLAGTQNKTNAYSYTNGIVVGPNTGPNTGPIDIDVQGVGFLGMDFSSTTNGASPDDTKSHVYLVKDVYDNASSPKTKPEITECTDVLLIGDTELICTMQLARSLILTAAQATAQGSGAAGLSAVAAHANTTRTITDAVTTAAGTTITSATAAFTASDVGTAVTNPTASFASGLYITAVAANGLSATLSAAAGAIATVPSVTTIGGPRTFATTTVTASSGSTTLTATFYPADIGRTVTGVGIAPNTTIASIGTTSGTPATATTATLSQATTAAITTATVTIGAPLPVPNDLYTVTVVSNGAPSGATTTQTNVSSGSTFTVAPY